MFGVWSLFEDAVGKLGTTPCWKTVSTSPTMVTVWIGHFLVPNSQFEVAGHHCNLHADVWSLCFSHCRCSIVESVTQGVKRRPTKRWWANESHHIIITCRKILFFVLTWMFTTNCFEVLIESLLFSSLSRLDDTELIMFDLIANWFRIPMLPNAWILVTSKQPLILRGRTRTFVSWS